jgi:AcrR family transcriptional regulator
MTPTVDGRRARGDRTRSAVAGAAAEIATLTGLDSITIAKLADATGSSPSGILTVFGNREAVQLAAVEHARGVFYEKVLTPALRRRRGAPRLSAITANWFDYVERGVFPGGCFLVTTSVEYGGQEGPVADAIRQMKHDWLQFLESEALAASGLESAVARKRAATVAFRLDAFMIAGHVAWQLSRDPDAMAHAKAACRELVASLRSRDRAAGTA